MLKIVPETQFEVLAKYLLSARFAVRLRDRSGTRAGADFVEVDLITGEAVMELAVGHRNLAVLA